MARRVGRGVAARATKASFNKAAKRIKDLEKGTVLSSLAGLRVIGEEIMLDVKAARPGAGVPVDTGALRSTGRVEGPKGNEVELSFGGAAADYALKVHEEVEIPHRVGEARYLVRGIDRWRQNGASVAAALAALRAAVVAVIARR